MTVDVVVSATPPPPSFRFTLSISIEVKERKRVFIINVSYVLRFCNLSKKLTDTQFLMLHYFYLVCFRIEAYKRKQIVRKAMTHGKCSVNALNAMHTF